MSGDWLKFEKSTLDKPEVHLISNILNIDHHSVIGKLLTVWSYFDTHSENGNAISVILPLLDRQTCDGFCNAMVTVGWLQVCDDMVTITNFERHNSESAKKRALGKNRADKHRSKSKKTKQKQSVKPKKKNSNASSVTNALPEKRREENITTPYEEETNSLGGSDYEF